MHNIYFYIILSISVIFFVIDRTISYLNSKLWSRELPEELKWIYDEKKYSKSQEYEKDLYRFSRISDFIMFLISMIFLIFFIYWKLDSLLRTFVSEEITLWLLFFSAIYLFNFIIRKPFSWYRNFKIEEKYSFNKMTTKTFITDSVKEALLSWIIWLWLLTPIIWIYLKIPDTFWIYSWILITAFSIFMTMFYSSLIVPIFNKQTPIPDWSLKNKIEDFAKEAGFKVWSIYVMDGSKRSTKANAYFSWFWNKRRIVLYDTLIEKFSEEEVLAVLAHEIWHYMRKHTIRGLIFWILQTWFMLYMFSLFVWSNDIASALWAQTASFHIWAFAFSVLFAPIWEIFSLLWNYLSRKYEYQADSFAKEKWLGAHLKSALIKLSVDNLSNLRPHPAYEFVHYSHPTLLKRLKNLN